MVAQPYDNTIGLMRDDELRHYRDLYATRLANLSTEITDDRPRMTPAELRATSPRLRSYLLSSGATRGVSAAELRASTAAFLRGLIAELQAELDRRERYKHVRTATANEPQFEKPWRDELKRRVNLDGLFEAEKGVRLGPLTTGKERRGPCPFCGGDEGSDRFAVYLDNPDNQRFKCYWCGAFGDAITAIELIYNVKFNHACAILATHAGFPLPASMRPPEPPREEWAPDYVHLGRPS